jgi:hypothetical protein
LELPCVTSAFAGTGILSPGAQQPGTKEENIEDSTKKYPVLDNSDAWSVWSVESVLMPASRNSLSVTMRQGSVLRHGPARYKMRARTGKSGKGNRIRAFS